MANAKTKKTFTVPVKVVASQTAEKPTPEPKPVQRAVAFRTQPRLPRAPIAEHVRRRWMWTLVSVATVAIVLIMIPLIRGNYSRPGDSFSSLWNKLRQTASTLTFKRSTADAAEKEIRQLDQQVFPELSQ